MPKEAAFHASLYLNGVGYVLGGIAMVRRSLAIAKIDNSDFKKDQEKNVEFYMKYILPRASTNLFPLIEETGE